MERPKKQKSMLLKFLPRPTPLSPGRDPHRPSTKLKSQPYKGGAFSGPIMTNRPGFEAREPTSPKVSCMGQIKCKKSINKLINSAIKSPDHHNSKPVKKTSSTMSKLFSRRNKTNGSSKRDYENDGKLVAPYNNEKGPTLGNMRAFASGRESLANFDWTAQIASSMDHDRDCYSDGEGGGGREKEYDYDDHGRGDREIIIPYSAPMVVGGGKAGLGFEIEPKKEINIWKRRTMTPPSPLTLTNSKVRS